MNARCPHLFALLLTLPLASCRFVGGVPDFSVMGDAISPAESDNVYVESKPTGSTPLAGYKRPTPPAPAPAQAEAAFSFTSQIQQLASFPDAPSTTPPAASEAPSFPPAANGIYTVQPGDSLARIARLHQVPLGSLAAVNGIDLRSPLIKPGQQLRIPQGAAAVVAVPRPAPTTPATAAFPETPKPAHPAHTAAPAPAANHTSAPKGQYRVSAGDTLYRIARQHGISLQELLRANNLTEESARSVRIGTLLTIPTQPHR